MDVIKKFAPNYWLGYYAVYMASLIALSARYGHLIVEGSGSEEIFVSAAIFGAATGIALTSAVTAEGVGYLVLLIPRRIKEIRDEGIEVGMKRGIEVGREEGRAEGREEGIKTGMELGAKAREEGRAEGIKTGMELGAKAVEEVERAIVLRLLARYERGEITLEDLRGILSGGLNGANGAD